MDQNRLGTLLLVDDELNVLRALGRVLSDEPYELFTAESGAAGLAILGERPVDVVMVDERMPGMSGSEMLAEVRRDYPQIVSIILTGHATIATAVRAINDGNVFKFLHKPCAASELKATVRAAFEQKQLAAASAQVLAFAATQRTPPAQGTPLAPSVGESGDGVRPFSTRERQLLTVREQEVLVLFVQGFKANQIAQRLSLSPATIRSHRKALYRKLDVHSLGQLVASFAAQVG